MKIKTVQIFLSEEEYSKLSLAASLEQNPIREFVTEHLLKDIEQTITKHKVDSKE